MTVRNSQLVGMREQGGWLPLPAMAAAFHGAIGAIRLGWRIRHMREAALPRGSNEGVATRIFAHFRAFSRVFT